MRDFDGGLLRWLNGEQSDALACTACSRNYRSSVLFRRCVWWIIQATVISHRPVCCISHCVRRKFETSLMQMLSSCQIFWNSISTKLSPIILPLLLPPTLRFPRRKHPTPIPNRHNPTNNHKLHQRIASPTPIIHLIRRPPHPRPTMMSRALQILMPCVMPLLIEMRHVAVETMRKTAGTRAWRRRRTRMVIRRALGPVRSVLCSFLAVCAPASGAVERGRRAFELRAPLAEAGCWTAAGGRAVGGVGAAVACAG